MNNALNESFEEARRVRNRLPGLLDACNSASHFLNQEIQQKPNFESADVVNLHASTSSSRSTSGLTSAIQNTDDEEDDESVNVLNELDNDRDENTILLLKQIFPDESAENLWQLHLDRCSTTASKGEAQLIIPSTLEATSPTLPCLSMMTASEHDTKRIERIKTMRKNIGDDSVLLPQDFLLLPNEVAAVRRLIHGEWQQIPIQDLTQWVIEGHELRYGKLTSRSYMYCTKVVPRDASGGLGITLISNEGKSNVLLPLVRVDALTSSSNIDGPAVKSGVRCNDVLIGVDGVAFAESFPYNESLLQHAVSVVRSALDPVVLHFIRDADVDASEYLTKIRAAQISAPSLIDTSIHSNDEESSVAPLPGDVSLHSDLSCSQAPYIPVDNIDSSLSSDNIIRPFVKVLANVNLLSSYEEQLRASKMLNDFDIRVNQWDELSAFFDPSKETLLSLVNVRKALSVRIVNTFDDDVDTAYTIWVYDVESGKEWYAPVRYFRDFEDLRSAVLPLSTASIQRTVFPKSKGGSSMNLFLRNPKRVETSLQRETKCRQLEHFLRHLCSMIYTEKLHPYIAEVAIHVQSFLGCDTQEEIIRPLSSPFPKYVDLRISKSDRVAVVNDDAQERLQTETRLRLKRTLQCFTYRLFLLDGMCRIVERFVDRLRISGPRLQDIENLEAKGRDVLKAMALTDLRQIQSFLDKIQGIILEGCVDDFMRIAQKLEYAPIFPFIGRTNDGSGYWDSLVREAVREQVEVEIYVPLRSVVSRWLVNGWRHEDMEVYFRMNELRRRPPEFFRIKNDGRYFDWKSVTSILNEGVGLSTLPCMKLRAIVEAAREIFRIITPIETTGNNVPGRHESLLGADDFLPIFIYCVIQAEMERPCALCILLRTLCDPVNQIGEIGYYLLTFEAAIKHCQEVDLTDHDREDISSSQTIVFDSS